MSFISATAQTTAYSIGSPTDEEQHYLELINRARANPTAEGLRLAATTDADSKAAITAFGVNLNKMKTEFDALPVRAPLALNTLLTNAARLHTQYLLETAQQSHTGRFGATLLMRLDIAGYDTDDYSENVFSYAKSTLNGHIGFQVDWGNEADGMQTGRLHRINIHGDYREVGIGVVLGSNTVSSRNVGPHLVTQDFGTSQSSLAFVTGVAYYDQNANSLFDPGEGIGGLKVGVAGSSFHAITANSGGYTVPVPIENATRAVTFTGLGADGSADALISGGNNVKVDFIPAYTAPTLTGPANAVALIASSYSFAPVLGASGYESLVVVDANAAADGADTLSRVTALQSGAYAAVTSSVKDSGTASYRLAAPAEGPQRLTYTDTFLVKNSASFSFRSRLGIATATQIAQVQASTDGGKIWANVYSQNGVGKPGETSFQTRTVSLASYAGKEVRLRFDYASSGSHFKQTSSGVGWYIDTVSFTNMVTTTGAVKSGLPPGANFKFTAPAAGNYLIAVAPVISGRTYSAGAFKAVTVAALPPSLAEIQVEQVPDTNLVDGASTVAFGSPFLTLTEARDFTVKNTGTEDLLGLTLQISGSSAADFTTSVLSAASLAPDASATFIVTFRPSAKGLRSALLRITSNDNDENIFDINLSGTGKNAPEFDLQPLPQVSFEKAQVIFTAHAVHPTISPIRYQWRKNNILIPGATSETLTRSNLQLADATTYSVTATAGTEVTTSHSVALVVVRPTIQSLVSQVGSSINMPVTLSGNGYALVWRRSVGLPPVVTTLSPTIGKTLTLAKLDPATHAGLYTCDVSLAGSVIQSGSFNLSVFNNKSQITAVQAMPNGTVSSNYSHQIKFDTTPTRAPSSFTVSPIPTGLKLDAKKGLLYGKPTVAKDYVLTITAKNNLGGTSITQTITIDPLPNGVEGSYIGEMERNLDLNGNLGGRLDLTITTTGAITGSLVAGTIKYPITGAVDIDVDRPANDVPEATLSILRKSPATPLTLHFKILPATHTLADASLTDGTHTAGIEGYRLIWKATGVPLNLATPTPKYFTFGLRPPAAASEMPRGQGYGSFTLGKDGRMNVTGKTSDGENFTCRSFAGPLGEIIIFQTLYTSKGSLLGRLDIDTQNLGNLASGPLDGSISWQRPPNVKALLYPLGFGPEALTAYGAAYSSPGNALILNMQPADSARWVFAEAGLAAASVNPNVSFSISAGNKFNLSTSLAANPSLVKITTFSASTGIFSGSFLLLDADPRLAFAGQQARRLTLFKGIMTQDANKPVGTGFFLLPKLPADANSAVIPPVPATTPKTALQLSGSVLLEKVP